MSGGKVVAWCELTPSGKIAFFDGKPMVMVGPVGNEHHTTPLVLQSDLDAAIARAEALEAMNHQQAKNIMEQETARRDAETQAEAAERDAERYRWLRDNPRHEHHPYFDDSVGKWCCPYLVSSAGGHGGGVGLRFFDTLDAAIAAQQAEGE